MIKPSGLVDREHEWAGLQRLADSPAGSLGVAWGPRRVGKSFLLGNFCDAVGGLFIQAVRQDPLPYLRTLGETLAERTGSAAPLRLDDWRSALDALLGLADCPVVVLDEFPYLVETSPELPTVVQAAVDRGRSRLVLCGSAISQMTTMLGADGPLYRRAKLALRVRPFDLRTAARFWGLEDSPEAALLVHAVVGGTPGYRDVMGRVAGSPRDWIIERVLDPSTATFHEDELALATDPAMPVSSVYRSVLAAVVAGARTPSGIASATGRKVTSLGRVLDRLVDSALLIRTPDPLRAKRSRLDVADNFLRFHYSVIRPNLAALNRHRAAEVWERSRATFGSQVLGPAFEQLCREAIIDYGSEFDMEAVSEVGSTVLNDPAARTSHEVDIVGTDADGRVVLLGEAKADVGRGVLADVRRLEHLTTLLPPGRRAEHVQLALFSATEFDPALSAKVAGSHTQVRLVGPSDLIGSG